MRWIIGGIAVVIALATLRAEARPRIDFEERHRRRRPPVCKPTVVWTQWQRCNLQGSTVQVLQDLPAAKLVAIGNKQHGSGRRQIALFVLAAKNWIRTSFYADTNPNSELLSFTPLAGAYRIDLGFAHASWVTLDDGTSRPAMLRRTYTYVCEQTAQCRSAQTSCDVLVRGKTVALFRAELVWDGKQLKLRGDTRNTNRYCSAPPAGIMESE